MDTGAALEPEAMSHSLLSPLVLNRNQSNIYFILEMNIH